MGQTPKGKIMCLCPCGGGKNKQAGQPHINWQETKTNGLARIWEEGGGTVSVRIDVFGGPATEAWYPVGVDMGLECIVYTIWPQAMRKRVFGRWEWNSCPLCSQVLLLGVPPMRVLACCTYSVSYDREVWRVLTTT